MGEVAAGGFMIIVSILDIPSPVLLIGRSLADPRVSCLLDDIDSPPNIYLRTAHSQLQHHVDVGNNSNGEYIL
jgi:hypothetical protein